MILFGGTENKHLYMVVLPAFTIVFLMHDISTETEPIENETRRLHSLTFT
jgi:hypothetical protein